MKNETSHNIEWESISKYLSGEMSEEERTAFEKLIDSNSEYAQIVAASEKDLGLVEDVIQIREKYNSDHAWNQVHSRISKPDNKNMSILANQNFKRVLQFAAMIVLVIGLGLVSNKVYKDYLSPYKTFISKAEDSSKTIVLADGSTVTLNGEAKLVYPKKFNSATRNVSLEGEAFFDIAKNPEKAFIITVKGAEIKVLGTSFNVIAQEDKVEVLVESGKVQFSELENNEESVILEKGDFAVLKENSLNKTLMNDDNYLSWKTQKMVFRGMPLKDVAKVIERTYRVKVEFESNDIANEKINTTFIQDPLNVVLTNICMSKSLTYEKKGQTITIKKGI
ncbi:FecR family protein [Marinifilum caeruleilacunae]|uniref:FecR family protein n=1 Tax=Marinifilum caeruleilacunae TaxID=2499076 RepID=A0ABX1WR81_9BACT|nr:FecR family protein [Marinifilum caeruleilacunae]NOU58590.1 FecR family protein [Marinifilum caeruleilacunae]